MKRVVKYTAVDPYYSDQEQSYIGASMYEIDEIQYETEQFMAMEHHGNLSMIYRSEILSEG